MSRLSRQCGILNISQPHRPPRSDTGIALLYILITYALCHAEQLSGGTALSFLNSTLMGGEWSAPRICRIAQRGRDTGTHCVGRGEDTSVCMDAVEKRRVLPSTGTRNPAVPRHYTDWAVPTHFNTIWGLKYFSGYSNFSGQYPCVFGLICDIVIRQAGDASEHTGISFLRAVPSEHVSDKHSRLLGSRNGHAS
jgi:hypothetical protein